MVTIVQTYERRLWVPQLVRYGEHWTALCVRCDWLDPRSMTDPRDAIISAAEHAEEVHGFAIKSDTKPVSVS